MATSARAAKHRAVLGQVGDTRPLVACGGVGSDGVGGVGGVGGGHLVVATAPGAGDTAGVKDLSKRSAFLVHFGYDGAPFFGLQPQPGLPTAGGALAERLAEACGQRPKALSFAARTDRGVHCAHNMATFWVPADNAPSAEVICAAVARPRDDGLRQVSAVPVPPTVHARGISRGKRYRYRLRDGVEAAADRHATDAWEIVPPLDVARMQRAAAYLVGRHDFSSLRGGGCSAATAEKTLFRLEVTRGASGADPDTPVDIVAVGDAFLRHMMRNLAGLLAEVGTGWRDPETMPAVLAAAHRHAAGLMAPPVGLVLEQVGCAWPEDGSGLLPELRAADGG